MLSVALKEWAVVVEALAAGLHAFLLRKGGITESSRGFELLHPEFLFFPSWEHQQREWIRPELHELFERSAPADPDRIHIRYRGAVEAVSQAPANPADLHAAGPHIWTDDFLRMRYEYRPDLPLWLVRVRAEALTRPFEIPYTPAYRGCKSWVELDPGHLPEK